MCFCLIFYDVSLLLARAISAVSCAVGAKQNLGDVRGRQ
jgi:hypothetical protein